MSDPDPGDIRAAREYFQSLGPWITADTAAEHLGIDLADLRDRANRMEILAVEFADGHLYCPRWQFDDEGVVRGLARALAELKPAFAAPETCIAWLLDCDGDDPTFRRIDELRAGGIESIVQHARYSTADWLRH